MRIPVYGKKLYLLFIPTAFFVLMIILNPLTHLVFYIDSSTGVNVYTHGALFNFLYACSIVYFIATFVVTICFRKRLQQIEFRSIIAFIVIVCTAIVIQYFYPAYLLIGIAITMATIMMFFCLQNPENMLDMISGVFNYNALYTYLRTQIDEGRDVWLVAVDVGGIRRINSAFGVRAGNSVIEQIGAFLNEVANENKAWAFRMIGTRFLIVADGKEQFEEILERVKERFAGTWVMGDTEVSLIATIRYCSRPDLIESPEDVINLIDLAYKEAGQDGWGSSRSINSALLQKGRRTQAVENAIRDALETREGFYLNFQPLYSPENDGYISAEVLLRLNSPEIGSISPAEFIPIAEQTGLINKIDMMVIDMSLDFIKRYPKLRDYGLKYLEVNLSAAEFHRDTAELVDIIVQQKEHSSDMICFEVTETAATTHQEILKDFMEKLIDHGYHFALDDFGTGYANISQIASLPFSMVKLDRSLLVAEDEKDIILFSDLVKMFSRMGLSTVVEGVETSHQAKRVTELGASHIQGFFYSRPLDEKNFIEFLLDKKNFA